MRLRLAIELGGHLRQMGKFRSESDIRLLAACRLTLLNYDSSARRPSPPLSSPDLQHCESWYSFTQGRIADILLLQHALTDPTQSPSSTYA
jgi:hypothetical protein